MAKLYFKYGVMGSSKSAQALITKFNYEQGGNKVLLLKPCTDNRDGVDIIKSRIGLKEKAIPISSNIDIFDYVYNVERPKPNVIICDESQFFTGEQIEELKDITRLFDIPVLCYGLLTDFKTNLFPGSKRLIELADSLQEIKMVCDCGKRASINARIVDGKIALNGEQVMIGGNESYKAMCYKCWKERINEEELFI
jgi:thymidine kinase